jgi:hypothetical protein
MVMLHHLAWIAMTVLRFGGVIAVFAGVAWFGVYFIGGNARAARDGDGAVPRSAWQGPGARTGIRIFAIGAVMLLGAFLLGLLSPSGA